MNDSRTALVILVLSDPHLLEGGQGSKNRTSDPDGIFALRRCDDFNLHGRRGQSSDFLLHAVSKARENGVATRQHDTIVLF
jgi:hypothetical protein